MTGRLEGNWGSGIGGMEPRGLYEPLVTFVHLGEAS